MQAWAVHKLTDSRADSLVCIACVWGAQTTLIELIFCCCGLLALQSSSPLGLWRADDSQACLKWRNVKFTNQEGCAICWSCHQNSAAIICAFHARTVREHQPEILWFSALEHKNYYFTCTYQIHGEEKQVKSEELFERNNQITTTTSFFQRSVNRNTPYNPTRKRTL